MPIFTWWSHIHSGVLLSLNTKSYFLYSRVVFVLTFASISWGIANPIVNLSPMLTLILLGRLLAYASLSDRAKSKVLGCVSFCFSQIIPVRLISKTEMNYEVRGIIISVAGSLWCLFTSSSSFFHKECGGPDSWGEVPSLPFSSLAVWHRIIFSLRIKVAGTAMSYQGSSSRAFGKSSFSFCFIHNNFHY